MLHLKKERSWDGNCIGEHELIFIVANVYKLSIHVVLNKLKKFYIQFNENDLALLCRRISVTLSTKKRLMDIQFMSKDLINTLKFFKLSLTVSFLVLLSLWYVEHLFSLPRRIRRYHGQDCQISRTRQSRVSHHLFIIPYVDLQFSRQTYVSAKDHGN